MPLCQTRSPRGPCRRAARFAQAALRTFAGSVNCLPDRSGSRPRKFGFPGTARRLRSQSLSKKERKPLCPPEPPPAEGPTPSSEVRLRIGRTSGPLKGGRRASRVQNPRCAPASWGATLSLHPPRRNHVKWGLWHPICTRGIGGSGWTSDFAKTTRSVGQGLRSPPKCKKNP